MKITKVEMVEAITEHFAKEGKRMTNVKKASEEKLKEILVKYAIDIVAFATERKEKLKAKGAEARKEKAETEVEWVSEFVVGEEVLFRKRHEANLKAIITKINKKSVSIKTFNYILIRDDEARRLQTYGEHKLIWLSPDKHQVVYSRGDLVKRGESEYHEPEFERGRKSCDFGN